ncbi:hypothetical protein FTX61_21200 [Nitriliruptoraceae bacterium ZYF776]|nr:hypothetical protein [Profundirhabdus halotolerans]
MPCRQRRRTRPHRASRLLIHSRGRPTAATSRPAATDAIAAHDRAEVGLTEAKHQLTRARDGLRDALFAAGKRYRDRQLPLPRADIHTLYWEHRQLRATDLANAFGITTQELARLAGPTRGYTSCRACEQVVQVLIDSRSPQHGRGPLCDTCREQERLREEEELKREHELNLARLAAGMDVPYPSESGYLHDRYGY